MRTCWQHKHITYYSRSRHIGIGMEIVCCLFYKNSDVWYVQYCPFCWVVECWIMNCLIFNARLLNTNNNPHFCKRLNNLQCDVFDDWKWIVKLIFFFNVKSTNYVLARPFGNMPRYLIGWLADHIAVIIHISLCCPCVLVHVKIIFAYLNNAAIVQITF